MRERVELARPRFKALNFENRMALPRIGAPLQGCPTMAKRFSARMAAGLLHPADRRTRRILCAKSMARALLVWGTVMAYSLAAGPGTVTYTYDNAGRLRTTSHNDGSAVAYTLDAAGNRITVVNTPPTPPQAPTLSATAPSYAQVDLTWTAALDPGGPGIGSYTIYRGGSQIATTTSTSYNDNTVVPSTTYQYTVAAYDTAGIPSPLSNTAQITTPAVNHPVVPTGLTASAPAYNQMSLNWASSTDPGGPGTKGYNIYRSPTSTGTAVQIGTSTTNSYTDTGLHSSTTYYYTVAAYDTNGNASPQSSQAQGTTPTGPGPTAPTNLSGSAVAWNQINLSWNASQDLTGPGVGSYTIYRAATPGGAQTQLGTTSGLNYSDTGLSPATTYYYTVAAADTAGVPSGQSNQIPATTPAPPTPPAPTGLSATAPNYYSVSLSWTTNSGDPGGPGLGGYKIYRSGTQIANVSASTTNYLDTGVSSGVSYTYTIASYDTFGTPSPQSSGVPVTVPNGASNNLTMTVGYVNYAPAAPLTEMGFVTTGTGSVNPTALTGGKTVAGFYDMHTGSAAYGVVKVTGFSTNPGAAWLLTATALGVTQSGTSASFSYSSGAATWTWTTVFGFPTSGTLTVNLSHLQ